MADFKIGYSPLSNKIYAGKVLKNGKWGSIKYDVTETAPEAVANYLVQSNQKMCFDYQGKSYELQVIEIIN